MCVCNPSIKSPYCGVSECQYPEPIYTPEDRKWSVIVTETPYVFATVNEHYNTTAATGQSVWTGYGDPVRITPADVFDTVDEAAAELVKRVRQLRGEQ